MLDKFMELSTRILKVLDFKRVELNINRYGNELIFGDESSKFYISEHPVSQGGSKIEIYTGYGVEILSYPGIKPYIDIISKIFYNHISFPRYGLYNIPSSAEPIMDEILNYSNEEFKLYISML